MKTFCSYYNQDICRSCDLISLDYSDQILLKEKALETALADLDYPKFLSPIHSAPTAFRNKAKMVVTGTLNEPIIGLWGESDLDRGRELHHCPLHVTQINEMLPALKDFIKTAKLVPYHIGSKTGELKGIILFHSEQSHETYLRFVLRSKESLDRIRKNQNILLQEFSHLQCISVNIQPVAHALLEGEEEIFITDKKSILHQLGETNFMLGPRAFVQTNQEVATKLYETAALWVKETKLRKFMELYCGQGAFSFFASPYIEQGMGVEINEEAIKEANRTAEAFGHTHLKFKSADAALIELEIKSFEPDIILVNPPRRGLAQAIKLLLQYRPEIIIYSSCNHETLCQDLQKLAIYYHITKIKIFDMFPNTNHFETLVQLDLKSI